MNLKQLAKELNLSISTISKALRDSHEISAATKQMVLSKAKELNYQANPFASSLRKQKSKTIGVMIPEIANNFFSLVINGVESIAQEKGYHVLIYLTHEDLQKEIDITQLLQNGRVDGVMLSSSCPGGDLSHLEELKNKDIPLVFFDRIVENIEAPKVITDDYNSAFKATEHLIEMGCTRIAFLSIKSNLYINNKRMQGYEDALNKHGLDQDNTLIVQCDNNDAANHDTIRNVLKKKNRPDGIFSSVENLAIASYHICKELQLFIPRDVKILSFCNLKTAALLNPALTTITQPGFEIGREAASILFKLIEQKGLQFIAEKTVLSSTLIERASTLSLKMEQQSSVTV